MTIKYTYELRVQPTHASLKANSFELSYWLLDNIKILDKRDICDVIKDLEILHALYLGKFNDEVIENGMQPLKNIQYQSIDNQKDENLDHASEIFLAMVDPHKKDSEPVTQNEFRMLQSGLMSLLKDTNNEQRIRSQI